MWSRNSDPGSCSQANPRVDRAGEVVSPMAFVKHQWGMGGASAPLLLRMQMHLHEFQEILPIARQCPVTAGMFVIADGVQDRLAGFRHPVRLDRKSTRLNSSHL